MKSLNTDSKNQLTSSTRTGTFTVAGVVEPGVTPVEVTVSGKGLSSGLAQLHVDNTWARAGATLANGNNSYTAEVEDNLSRTAQDNVSVNLPATVNFQYDGNGNLTNDGRRVFEYDPPHEIAGARQFWQSSRSKYAAAAGKAVPAYLTGQENQLTNVYMASAWKSVFQYDAFGRRRVRKEYGWQSSAWVLTNEVRYVYDGMLVVQERDANNLALVSYTRGNDLSGSRQGAGGIGGLLARTDHALLNARGPSPSAHAYYHCDGNGNITALADTNGFIVARYQYDPYGNVLGMSGPLAEANTYRFSSKEWHANSGLYYYGFRYYEPNLQRWLNQDPMGEFAELNLHRFNYNNAVNFIDPDGLWGVQIGGINFGYGDPTYVFEGVDWDGYWGDVGDTLIGELKGAGSELSFGLYQPCYTSALQKQGGYVGTGLAMAGETLAGGAAGWKLAGKQAFEKNGKKYVMDFSHSIPANKLPGGRNGALDKFLTKTKLNGNYVTPKRHYKHDPDYFGNMPGMTKDRWRELFGDKWPAPLQALDRIPRFPAGVAIGAGYAAGGFEGGPPGNGCY